MKVIELHKSVTDSNDRDAQKLREELKEKGVFFINPMSAAGSGKTTLLLKTIEDLKDQYRIAVLEADIEADVDAIKIENAGARSIQVHTDGMCHMDAGMTRTGLEEMGLEDVDLAFLENIGNLICPAEYDTGAIRNVMILSIPEGDDKPLKYPLMFTVTDLIGVTKTDVRPAFDFDGEAFVKNVRLVNPSAPVLFLSSKTGEGIAEMAAAVRERIRKKG
jgi:hydrogenase nickel incorporation protein HypB